MSWKLIKHKFLLLLGSTFLIALFLYAALLIYVAKNAEIDNTENADAILVLGARAYINGAYNPCLKARVDHAVQLYKEQKATKIVFSGGTDLEDGENEALVMSKIAIEQGVNQNDILLEQEATSTYENFLNSKIILELNNLHSIILVTEPFHMLRAKMVANHLGIKTSESPAITSSCWTSNKYFSKYILKEPFAIMSYKLKNYL